MISMYPMKALAQATPAKTAKTPAAGRRIQVRKSGVHGKGVYALRPLKAGEKIIEYTGEVITWKEALRDVSPGEELFYDYGLVIDERMTPKLKKQYECRCGSPACRGTMLASRRR